MDKNHLACSVHWIVKAFAAVVHLLRFWYFYAAGIVTYRQRSEDLDLSSLPQPMLGSARLRCHEATRVGRRSCSEVFGFALLYCWQLVVARFGNRQIGHWLLLHRPSDSFPREYPYHRRRPCHSFRHSNYYYAFADILSTSSSVF